MNLKVGDKVKIINRGEIYSTYLIGKEGIELINESRHFKSLPNDYTGTIEVENGFIQERKILDEAEKRYLKAVIRPFKDRVKFIFKTEDIGEYFIEILLNNDTMIFPNFKKGTMYNGMAENKKYTLKELGLDE